MSRLVIQEPHQLHLPNNPTSDGRDPIQPNLQGYKERGDGKRTKQPPTEFTQYPGGLATLQLYIKKYQKIK